ncbi:GerMN domain-containing protein, partial [Nocardioides stalactiti]|uniref:GerMN domain-containing protein n=1 Tax=Nocardioides stalactiti TaxID=2755356 RepID=UPI001603D3CA
MRRAAMVAAGILATTLLAGCIDLPDSGPVVTADSGAEQDNERASSIDARPPQPGDSRLEIVNGFLEAMMAWPISTSVAKEYLSEDAAEEWEPDETIIYTDLATPREDGSTVSIRMRGAAMLDESGGWRDSVPSDRSLLEFRMTIEEGEFRILDPLDALVVRTSWFQQRYRQASLFYFDRAAQVLVPEPVFVPVGESFATTLVTALVAGPPARLDGVVTSFVPPRLSVGLSVPVVDGVATLDLHGDAPRSPAETELMMAQLAATLGQDPAITALRVTIGGQEIVLPGAGSLYAVGAADAFDAADTGSAGVLYGLRRGRLVVGGFPELRPVDGPVGR